MASRILLLNLNSSSSSEVTLFLDDDQGNPLPVELNGEMVVGQQSLVLPPGALRVLETDDLGPLLVGSVTVCSSQPLSGVILFAGTAGVAGVRSSLETSGFLAPLETDLSSSINTGIAVMNTNRSSPIALSLSLLDPDRSLLATAVLELVGGGYRSLFLNEIRWEAEPGVVLDLGNFRGLLQATGASFAGTILQTRFSGQQGQFSTLPVLTTGN